MGAPSQRAAFGWCSLVQRGALALRRRDDAPTADGAFPAWQELRCLVRLQGQRARAPGQQCRSGVQGAASGRAEAGRHSAAATAAAATLISVQGKGTLTGVTKATGAAAASATAVAATVTTASGGTTAAAAAAFDHVVVISAGTPIISCAAAATATAAAAAAAAPSGAAHCSNTNPLTRGGGGGAKTGLVCTHGAHQQCGQLGRVADRRWRARGRVQVRR